MRNHAFFLLCALALTFVACSNDDDTTYPDIISDFVIAVGNAESNVESIITDDGLRLPVVNKITGIKANTKVRSICDYVITTDNRAQIYSIRGIPLLARLPEGYALRYHPTGVASVWQRGGYINLHLLPKTHGGLQNWAIVVDSTQPNTAGGTNHFLSIYHDQNSDQLAYTGHVYASIDPDSVTTNVVSTDSVSLTINTFTGQQTWHFPLRQ